MTRTASFFHALPKTWSVEAFLRDVLPTSLSSSFDEVTGKYVDSLVSISKEQLEKRRSKAYHLLQRFNEGKRPDYHSAKEVFETFHPKPSATTINVQNSVIGTVTGSSTGPVIGSVIGLDYQATLKRKSEATQKNKIPSQNFLEDFEEAYKCMPIAAKLCLDGINFVDRVFENAKHLTNEFAVHLWVIDLQDPWIIALFPEYGCLDAIYPTVITPILDPPMPNVLISSLQDVVTTEDFRNVLYSKPPIQGPGPEWVHAVYVKMLALYESPNSLLKRKNPEGFFGTHIWPCIIDGIFLDMPDIILERTELSSVSAMEYLNRKRTHTSKSRVISGPKIDGIIREFGDYPLEYGAIEVSPSHKGKFATKWITDRTKLLKVLGHMVRRLYRYFSSRGGKPEDAEKIQVIGMLCSGYRIQVIRVSTNGHVCFVSVISSGCTLSVPADNGDLPNPSLYLDHTIRVPTESRDLRNLSPLLSCLWQARQTIARSAKIVHSPISDRKE